MRTIFVSRASANALAAILGLSVGLGAAEVVCSLFDDTRPVYQVLHFERGNSNYELARHVGGDLVYEYVPNASMAGLKINSLGLRDLERTAEKPAGVERVICVGDSITMGGSMAGWLPLEQTWPLVLERMWKERSDRSIEVWNAGFSGYNLVQYRAFLERRCKEFEPDLIILGLCFNDLSASQEIKRTRAGFDVVFRRNEVPVVLDLGRTVNPWLFRHSALWRVVNTRLADIIEPGAGLLDPDGAEAEKSLAEIVSLGRKLGAPVLALLFPRLNDDGYGNEGSDRDHRRLVLALQRQGVPYADMGKVFSPYPVESIRVVPRDNGHPNAFGHCLAARAAYELMSEHGPGWARRGSMNIDLKGFCDVFSGDGARRTR